MNLRSDCDPWRQLVFHSGVHQSLTSTLIAFYSAWLDACELILVLFDPLHVSFAPNHPHSEAEWAEKEACACIYIFALYAWAECTFCNFSGYSGFTLQCKQNANITKISVSGWVAMLSLAARSDGAQCSDTLWSHFWTAQKKIHSYMATTRLHIFHLNNLYTYCSMTLLTCNGGHIYHLFNEERMCSQGG